MKTIPMYDAGRLYARHRQEIEAAALAALRSGLWINGEHNTLFATEFAAFIGVPHCVLVANGTDALELALASILDEPDPLRTEVITVANAGGYTTSAARRQGFVPVYADIEQESQLLSIPSAVSALNEATLAVVATHLYGGVIDVPALRNAMDTEGYTHVPIVEDCAQAHGAKSNKLAAGAMGDIATFSFYPTKNLGALGDAGAVLCRRAETATRVRQLQQYGWTSKYAVGKPGGRNSRIDEIQAAMLSALLPHLDQNNEERKAIKDAFRETGAPNLSFVQGGPGAIAHLIVVRTGDRNRLRSFLLERGISSDIHYPVLDCDQLGWRGLPQRIAPEGLAVSRRSVGEILTLPCFPGMEAVEIERVCHALTEWGSQ